MHYTLHLNVGDKNLDIKFMEQEKPTKDSIQFNGRNYSIECPEDQKDFFKSVIENVLGQADQPESFAQLKDKIIEHLNSNDQAQAKTISRISQKELNLDSKINNDTVIKGEIAQKMDRHLESIHNLISFSGTVLVKKDGETILKKGYGEASSQAPNSTNTVFQIASVTKQFTAAAILKLVEDGEKSGAVNPIKLDDPINKHLPTELQSKEWDQIQIQHLLSHRSGLITNDESDEFKKAKEAKLNNKDNKEEFKPSKSELIALFQDKKLRGDVDKETHYSNFGYYLLGAIIEHHTGRAYGDFIKTILPPEMKSTGYYEDENYKKLDPSRVATGYHLNLDQELEPHRGAVATEAYAAGGLYSSVDDLSKWNEALLSGNIIRSSSVKQMTTSHGVDPMTLQSFGYGLERGLIAERDAVFHGGTLDGFKAQSCTFLSDDPRKSDMIIILSNDYDIPEINIRNNLASILNNKEFEDFADSSNKSFFPSGEVYHKEGTPDHKFIEKNGKYYLLVGPSPVGKTKVGEEKEDKPVIETRFLAPLNNGRYLDIKWGVRWEFSEGIARGIDRAGVAGELKS